jgi:ADP-heptose:LPS heptosyltransferase
MVRPFPIVDRLLAFDRHREGRSSAPRGVLLIAAGGLGDAVLLAHVLPRFLALAEPDEDTTLLLRHDAAKMTFLFPPNVKTITVDFGRFLKTIAYRRATMVALYRAHYRHVVSLDYRRHPWIDEAMVAAAEAPEALAMIARPWPKYADALERNRALFSRLYDSGPPVLDKVIRWTRFANWLAGRDDPPPLARLSDGALPGPETVAQPTVVFQPFSAVPEKQPAPAIWRAIIASLPAGFRVVVAGAPTDLDSNPEYLPLLKLPNVAFDGRTFKDLVPLLRAARLVVAADTALMHLAIAVGAPTLGLASAAFVGEIVPYDPAVTPPNAHFLYHDMPCRGCLGTCILPAEAGRFPCVARLDESAVLATVKELLRRPQ